MIASETVGFMMWARSTTVHAKAPNLWSITVRYSGTLCVVYPDAGLALADARPDLP
jgi:hypothetical protein